MPLAGEPVVLSPDLDISASLSRLDGFEAYCRLLAYAYSGRGRDAGLRASACDRDAASAIWRERGVRFCGRRRRVAMTAGEVRDECGRDVLLYSLLLTINPEHTVINRNNGIKCEW